MTRTLSSPGSRRGRPPGSPRPGGGARRRRPVREATLMATLDAAPAVLRRVGLRGVEAGRARAPGRPGRGAARTWAGIHERRPAARRRPADPLGAVEGVGSHRHQGGEGRPAEGLAIRPGRALPGGPSSASAGRPASTDSTIHRTRRAATAGSPGRDSASRSSCRRASGNLPARIRAST